MSGMPTNISVDEGVSLPRFPGDPSEFSWQSKSLPGVGPYRITEDGRLLRKECRYVEKTNEEKREEAESQGFDSWSEYRTALQEMDVDERLEKGFPLAREEKAVDEWWADHNMHGEFEFHALIGLVERSDGTTDGYFWSYEAVFIRGALQEIRFNGERGGPKPGDTEFIPPEQVSFEE